ncbi:hypothetical protein O9G_002300 [Rozella allomycis CSF55]|uniref:Proteasome assembly chaperone 1 n=1 Tax=Rozella allomycis (strain CSF55) TaxID=988480 RepID=A0A075AQM2_ROZAC|nr:hypothetical protein O9G_002300 [Rozella allomycis CSF55]|eukprot:EPZ32523.1 hypothetical protein O9G_002300 [Rozella allomycis CSF55]
MTLEDFSWLPQNRNNNLISRSCYEDEVEQLNINSDKSCHLMWKVRAIVCFNKNGPIDRTTNVFIGTLGFGSFILSQFHSKKLVGTIVIPDSYPVKSGRINMKLSNNPYILIYQVLDSLVIIINHDVSDEVSFDLADVLLSKLSVFCIDMMDPSDVFEKHLGDEHARICRTDSFDYSFNIDDLESPSVLKSISAAVLSHQKCAALIGMSQRKNYFPVSFFKEFEELIKFLYDAQYLQLDLNSILAAYDKLFKHEINPLYI